MNEAKYLYLLELADDSAILGQRLGEWCGHGPALELDMALTNISLDLFGQARSLYQYAAEVEGKGRSEDDLCFLRKEHEFRNCLLVELPNGDFADTILRQYLFDAYQYELYQRLSDSADEQLAGFAQKSLKETVYHRRLSGEWVKRLGDGTDESHERIQRALNDIWSFTGSLFVETAAAKAMKTEGVGVLASSLKNDWLQEVKSTLEEATLSIPESEWMHEGGKSSLHTEHLGYLLAEMQMMQRTYPGQEW